MSVKIGVYKDGRTGYLQISIEDEGTGYRLAGPKFIGSSAPVLEHQLSERDANEIRGYLDDAFPPTKDKK